MLPVVYEGAQQFWDNEHLWTGLQLCNPLSFENVQQLPSLLSDHADYCKMVFGVKTVSNYRVDAFFFQLFASKCFAFNMNKKSEVTIALAKYDNRIGLYNNVKYWDGFEFWRARPGGESVLYSTLLSRETFQEYFQSN